MVASQQAIVRFKHTVRIILKEDLPDHNNSGEPATAAAGEVIHVKAGYARNYLIPQKIALYATPANFERLGMKDPDLETPEEKRLRLERELRDESDEDLKAANLLRHYLRNKVVSDDFVGPVAAVCFFSFCSMQLFVLSNNTCVCVCVLCVCI